jgi:hypothetical protein
MRPGGETDWGRRHNGVISDGEKRAHSRMPDQLDFFPMSRVALITGELSATRVSIPDLGERNQQ